MNWLRLLILLRKFPLKDLLNFPKDITNSAACRKWVLAVLNSLEVLAELTGTEVDDEVVETIEGIVRNDNAWSLIHEVLVKLVGGNDLELTRLQGVASVRGFNPMIIMVIIQAVALFLKLFRSRK